MPPILSGTSSDEGPALVRSGLPEPLDPKFYKAVVLEALFKGYGRKIYRQYPLESEDARDPLYEIVRDVIFHCPERSVLNNTISKNWVYLFSKPAVVQRPEGQGSYEMLRKIIGLAKIYQTNTFCIFLNIFSRRLRDKVCLPRRHKTISFRNRRTRRILRILEQKRQSRIR